MSLTVDEYEYAMRWFAEARVPGTLELVRALSSGVRPSHRPTATSCRRRLVEFQVCPTCDGRGHHVNPSIDAHGISPEEFYEDPDFAESYFAGHYDVPCYECGGQRVVPGFDEERLSADDKEALRLLNDQMEAEAEP